MWAPSSSRLTLASTAKSERKGVGRMSRITCCSAPGGCGSITRRRAVRVSRSSCVFLAFRAASLQVALGLWTDRAGAHALASALRAGPACLPASEYRWSYAAKRAVQRQQAPRVVELAGCNQPRLDCHRDVCRSSGSSRLHLVCSEPRSRRDRARRHARANGVFVGCARSVATRRSSPPNERAAHTVFAVRRPRTSTTKDGLLPRADRRGRRRLSVTPQSATAKTSGRV